MPSETRFALSLFSGAGGMDIGVRGAGFDVVGCVEIDPHCCETLRAAATREKRRTLVAEGDIRTLDPDDLRRELRLARGELSLLFGGPPCQPFSQIGKRMCLEDSRGPLLFEIVRFAKIFRPRAILIEQVKGLLNSKDASGNPGGVFSSLLSEIENMGYMPKWQVLNSADLGVPQKRQRVFIVATPRPNGFAFPLPTHGPNRGTLFPLSPYVTVGEALQGLGKPMPSGGYQPVDSHMDVTPEGDRRRIHGVPEGSHLSASTHLPKEQRGKLTRKDTTKFRRLSRSEPSLTLRCGEIFFHPTEDRYLTPREYMRIHGFPDDYLLKGPIRGRSGRVRNLDQHRQVANSVPPPVSKAIAEAIGRVCFADALLGVGSSPRRSRCRSTA